MERDLTAPESGSYWINLGELGATGSVTIDGAPVIRQENFPGVGMRFGTIKAGENGVLPTTGGLNNLRAQVTLSAGPHSIQIEDTPDMSGDPVQLQLNWVTPVTADRKPPGSDRRRPPRAHRGRVRLEHQ